MTLMQLNQLQVVSVMQDVNNVKALIVKAA
jgi:hypothetical protein